MNYQLVPNSPNGEGESLFLEEGTSMNLVSDEVRLRPDEFEEVEI